MDFEHRAPSGFGPRNGGSTSPLSFGSRHGCSQRRPLPRRGQVKAAIAASLVRSVSALLKREKRPRDFLRDHSSLSRSSSRGSDSSLCSDSFLSDVSLAEDDILSEISVSDVSKQLLQEADEPEYSPAFTEKWRGVDKSL